MKKFKAIVRGRKDGKTVQDQILPPTTDLHDGAVEPGPSPPPPAVTFPEGIKELHTCDDAVVDVCFVHGLTGNREETWTAPSLNGPWPKLLLPHRLRQARILTWGYDAYLVRGGTASSNRLIDHSTNLVNDLTADRAEHNASSRSLIFVAHSLGGLVCKMAIMTSRDSPAPHLKDIFSHVKGVLFMGTPHTGSWMADWAKIPTWGLGVVKSSNRSLLTILQTEDQLLESLQISFLSMLRDLRDNHQRRIEVTCFFEELPLPVVGQVVSKASATFSDHPLMSIHGNHSDMVKFATIEDNGFKRVAGELVRWELELT
jgi:pimeloyl-ACP methyl ester carboxylesterase